MIKQKDLILVPFPFSDQSGRKVRPVIVISNNKFNESSDDVLVIGVTSNLSKDECTISLNNKNLEQGKIITNCCIKIENISKLDKELIIKKIGQINKATLKNIIEKLLKIIKP